MTAPAERNREMRLNTPEQVANGRRLLARYGSWDRIRAASRYDHKRGGFIVTTEKGSR